jgi:hypothetical protein
VDDKGKDGNKEVVSIVNVVIKLYNLISPNEKPRMHLAGEVLRSRVEESASHI